MQKRSVTFALAVLLVTSVFAMAQMPQAPKVGPEQKNLDFFAGNWTVTGDLKPGPMGPGGKYNDKENIEWMNGGFFLIAHTDGDSPMGKVTGLALYGYDTNKKAYTYDEFNSSGEAVHATGAFDGKVWTWTSDIPMGPQTMKSRFVETVTSPTSYSFKFEVSTDGTKWTPVLDGTATKK